MRVGRGVVGAWGGGKSSGICSKPASVTEDRGPYPAMELLVTTISRPIIYCTLMPGVLLLEGLVDRAGTGGRRQYWWTAPVLVDGTGIGGQCRYWRTEPVLVDGAGIGGQRRYW